VSAVAKCRQARQLPCNRLTVHGGAQIDIANSYDVTLDEDAAGYSLTMMEYPCMKEWIAAAKLEPDELEELDVEF
jgi:hypothetical protein